ncbi:hypothetical protein [Stygiobacter electus]|uniref:TerB-C domain-containing protein n=1 Tax=Stygiobacter electus TaxID=3032292 RepID=A0AAE3P493_9BACT|nr:hypothetical protein [Stygiobacter electus]MDF1612625.1 hypothetical protein [Stygiobacter electus]
MFEREIKFIYDFNLNKVNKLGPYFTFEQLQNSDLHPAILHYISAEVDYLVFEDRQKLLKNSVFDYSGEKISHYFSLITAELKKNKRFSLEYIAKLILHATSFTVNFLVRPSWTITRFIFDESKHKTTNEIKQILNYIYYYKYLKTIIISYLSTKKILSMNVEEFEELITKTDRISVESNFNGIISNSLTAMAEFFNIGQMQKTKIPLTAVELFLEEKNLPIHLQKITEVFGTDENATYYISDYMRILNSVIILEDEVIEETEQQEFELENVEQENLVTETPNEQIENDLLIQDNFEINQSNQEENNLNKVDENELIHEKDVNNDTSTNESIDEDNDVDTNETMDKSEIDLIDEPNFENEEFVGFTNEEIDELRNEINLVQENEDEEEQLEKNQLQEENHFQNNQEEIDNIETDINSENDMKNESDNFNYEQNQILTNQDVTENEVEISDETNSDFISSPEQNKKLELIEIIEQKDVSKIIETIFDFDFDDFSNTLEEISQCKNIDDAILTLNDMLSKRKINPNSREAESLKNIITEYFNQ